MNIFASKRWKKVLLLTSLVTVLVGYFLGTQNEGLPSDAKSLSYMTLYGLKSYWEDKGSIQMLQKDLLQRHQPLRGKLALVTGATKGLGRGIAAQLHALGADLILPCRSIPAGLARRVELDSDELYRQNGLAVPSSEHPTVLPVIMDLSDLNSIDKGLIDIELNVKDRPIEILVSNAGLIVKDDVRSPQGFELIFAVNFLGAAYLTSELKDKSILRAGPSGEPAVVVSVSSGEHRAWKSLNQTGLPFGTPFSNGISDVFHRYAYSKLAITTWMLAFANKHPELRVLDLCPGPVGSEIAGKNGMLGQVVVSIMQATLPSIFHSAIFIIRLITEAEFQHVSGRHYHMSKDFNARSDALDPSIQDWVYKQTKALFSARAPPSIP